VRRQVAPGASTARDRDGLDCPRLRKDHIVPLCKGGADHPSTMQWQTVAEGKAKENGVQVMVMIRTTVAAAALSVLVFCSAGMVSAQVFLEKEGVMPTQWEPISATLAQLVGLGARVVSVVLNDSGAPGDEKATMETYFLQRDKVFMKCVETYVGGNATQSLTALKQGRIMPLIGPSAGFACWQAVNPHQLKMPPTPR
jgi:hypothetical protein